MSGSNDSQLAKNRLPLAFSSFVIQGSAEQVSDAALWKRKEKREREKKEKSSYKRLVQIVKKYHLLNWNSGHREDY